MECRKCHSKDLKVLLQTGDNEFECSHCWVKAQDKAREVNERASERAAKKEVKNDQRKKGRK